jgi:hypothetical protein
MNARFVWFWSPIPCHPLYTPLSYSLTVIKKLYRSIFACGRTWFGMFINELFAGC